MLSLLPLSMSRLSLLVDLASLLAREVDLDALLSTACERMAEALLAERASIWLVDADRAALVTRVALLPEVSELRQPLGRGLVGHVAESGEIVAVDDVAQDARFDPTADRVTGYTTRSALLAPIREHAHAPVRGVVQVLNHRTGRFDAEDARYLGALALQLGAALALTTLSPANAQGRGFTLRGPFNHIVGRSELMDTVYRRMHLAAQTDASVLIRGETGTGKGLLARAIHVNSPRQTGPFVTIDCTTLPAQLVESELFGHERGAFTGADRRVPGRVELAAGGTLFLDEIAELGLDVQAKLLRFLQERSFERVGGRQELRADVRIICATHRDLGDAVRAGKFREDLFFRVRVVQIDVPPLRDRGAQEIEILAKHFADVYAKRYERPAPTFAPEALASLKRHAFPGNVRELMHWVESAIVMAPDGHIREELWPSTRRPESQSAFIGLPEGLSLDEVTRRYVEATLAAVGGNRTEAARRLGIGRNTITRLLKGSEK
jgi:Nif-specific regulatory protein